MKKILSLLLITAMLAAMFAACGKTDKPDNTDGTSGTDGTTVTTQKPEEIKKNPDYTPEALMSKMVEALGGKNPAEEGEFGSLTIGEDEMLVTGPKHFSISNKNEGKYYSGIEASASLVEDDAVYNDSVVRGGSPYSFVIVKLKDAKNSDTLKEEMKDGVNMRRWVCRNADYLITVNNGNYLLLVMGSKDACEKTADAFDSVLEEKSGARLVKEYEEDLDW